eukprot:TRINITY_DN65022_c0_g1_i1.p1 TRINITY_DN65022_c0_g1~~TRINITY_DN65022_c0_g1_i1.p1  ORF type:complete len:334 (+),score=89.34 TRINITY_DN65022_c0_g1_i1:91-1092(+)
MHRPGLSPRVTAEAEEERLQEALRSERRRARRRECMAERSRGRRGISSSSGKHSTKWRPVSFATALATPGEQSPGSVSFLGVEACPTGRQDSPRGTPYVPSLPPLLQSVRPERDREKEQWPGGAADYVPRPEFRNMRNYRPAAQRAAEAAGEAAGRFLPQPLYNGPGYNTRNATFPIVPSNYDLRSSDAAGNVQPHPMRFAPRSQRERVADQLQGSPRPHVPRPPASVCGLLADGRPAEKLHRERWVDPDRADFARYYGAAARRRPLFSCPERRTPSPYTDHIHHSCAHVTLRQREMAKEIPPRDPSPASVRRGFQMAAKAGAYFQRPIYGPI